MKRGTPRHPKVLRLLQALDLSRKHTAEAIGYLELLWHFTAEFAPQGDVGRYEDDQIEGALHWYGRRGRLIHALTTAKWLDESRLNRLIVHDWKDHADEGVRKKLKRSSLYFISVTDKVSRQSLEMSATLADSVSLPVPVPVPMPEPEERTPLTPHRGARRYGKRNYQQIGEALGAERTKWWIEFWQIYPCHEGKLPAMDAFEAKVTSEEIWNDCKAGALRYADKFRSDPSIKLKFGQGWINDLRWDDEHSALISNSGPSLKGNGTYPKRKTFLDDCNMVIQRNLQKDGKPW